MLKKTTLITLFLVICAADARAQWVAQVSGTNVRLRGVSAVSRRVAWASGAGGTYARTVDGGRTWRAGQVPGASELDFRDVDAFDANTAYLLAIGEGERSRIYKTNDGGRNWTLQFRNRRAGAFYDCMAFWDGARGLAVSDPVDGRFLVVRTEDGGRTWKEIDAAGMPPALAGEGGFAASGTCVAVDGTSNAWFGTGGPEGGRVFRSKDGGRTWQVAPAPLKAGKSAGVFSLAFYGDAGAAVGGDYTKEQESEGSAAVTSDGGVTWRALGAEARPGGYRSCVAYVPGTLGRTLVAVGPSGSDYSTDGGQVWKPLGAEGFHAVGVSPRGDAAWAVGENGRVARLDSPSRLSARPRRSPARSFCTPAQPTFTPARPSVTFAKPSETSARPSEQPARASVQPARPPEQPARPPEQPARAPEHVARAPEQAARACVQPARACEHVARACVQAARAPETLALSAETSAKSPETLARQSFTG
ncbi:MAG TPA: hypothetical protein VF591_15555 [Pyrinomonadaceae bacterium]|jgi:photosystem II stability/assembly factor-like uncharacterized protein